MTDILGPASAPNATTDRPSEGRSFGALDSWFKDCSSDTADDGTDIEANWLNGVTAALRALWRGNGKKADGITPVVIESGLDDYGLLTSVSHLIQRGQARYGRDTSNVAGVLSATLIPAVAENKEGMVVNIKAANTSGAGSTLNVGPGPLPIIRPDGSALRDGDIVAGSGNAYFCDGTHFQLMGADAIPVLKRNLNYYVGGTGASDSNDGLSATVAGGHGPFATLQKAEDTIAAYNLNGFSVNVFVANGTYPPLTMRNVAGDGTVNYIGNPGSPTSCAIAASAASTSAVTGNNCGASHTFNGFDVSATGTGYSSGFALAGIGSSVFLQNISYGPCTLVHNYAATGSIGLAGALSIRGGAQAFSYAYGQGGLINTSTIAPPSLTITAPVTFSAAFAVGTVLAQNVMQFASITGAGNVSGPKYQVNLNAVINTNAGGENYLPGTIAGSRSNGGVYN